MIAPAQKGFELRLALDRQREGKEMQRQERRQRETREAVDQCGKP